MDAAAGWPPAAALAVAAGANLAANAVLALTWGDIVAAAGTRLDRSLAAWIWASSQLSRYLIGGAQIAGRAVVAARHGVTLRTGGASAVIEVILAFCVASAAALATVPSWAGDADAVRWLGAVAVVPAGLFVSLVVAPGPTTRVLAGAMARLPAAAGRFGSLARDRIPPTGLLARVAALMLTNFAIRVAGFAVLVAGASEGVGAGRLVGAYALGQVAGRVAIFAPGGVGPREGVTALVLAPVTGMGGAVAIVAAARLVEVVAELGFLGIAFGAFRRHAARRRSEVVEVGPGEPPRPLGEVEAIEAPATVERDHAKGEAPG